MTALGEILERLPYKQKQPVETGCFWDN